jgi:hypothetical protein
MKKLFTALFASAALFGFAQTNIPNGSFETWSNGVPVGWTKLSGRVRQYASKTFSLNTQQGQVTGTLRPSAGNSFLGLLNDSPAVDGSITIGSMRTNNFELKRKPGEFLFNFYYLAGVQTETFIVVVNGFTENFGVNDTILRKLIYFNQTGVLGTLPSNGNYGWLSVTVPLNPGDYIDNQTPDSAYVQAFCTGLFAQGAPRSTTVNTELLLDNMRFNAFTTSSKIRLNASNQIAAYNYPNPAADYTTFVYELPTRSDVTLNIYDINGKMVSTQTFKAQEAGQHQTFFSTESFSNGIYFYTIDSEYNTESGKLIISK